MDLSFLNGVGAAFTGSLAFILMVLWLVKSKNGKRRELFNRAFNFSVKDWKYDVLLPATVAVALSAFFYFWGGFLGNPALSNPTGIAYSTGIAPFFEEMFFRGMLIGIPLFWQSPPLARRIGIPEWLWAVFLIFVVSSIFMKLHWMLSLDVFISSLLYGGLYVWRKSLVPAIVAHSLSNFMLLALAMLVG